MGAPGLAAHAGPLALLRAGSVAEAHLSAAGVSSRSPPDLSLGLELQTQQSQPQDASCLPALKVSDIEPTVPLTELEVALAGVSVGEGAAWECLLGSVSPPSSWAHYPHGVRVGFPCWDQGLPCPETSALPRLGAPRTLCCPAPKVAGGSGSGGGSSECNRRASCAPGVQTTRHTPGPSHFPFLRLLRSPGLVRGDTRTDEVFVSDEASGK